MQFIRIPNAIPCFPVINMHRLNDILKNITEQKYKCKDFKGIFLKTISEEYISQVIQYSSTCLQTSRSSKS